MLLLLSALAMTAQKHKELPVVFRAGSSNSLLKQIPIHDALYLNTDSMAEVYAEYHRSQGVTGIHHIGGRLSFEVDSNGWTHEENAERTVYLTGIYCPKAASVSVIIKHLYLDNGAELFIFSPDGR